MTSLAGMSATCFSSLCLTGSCFAMELSSLWTLTAVICLYLDTALAWKNDTSLHRHRRQSCGEYEFRCASGQCIDSTNVCDGSKDCLDGSDETDKQCSRIRCPPFAFQCSYGACVDGRARCNGVSDCVDGSDELHPSCTKQPVTSKCRNDEFLCKSGECIDGTLTCDGSKDCSDMSDEIFEQCNNVRCPPFTFRCSYGACIDRNGRCNGRPECADDSDEDAQLCGTGNERVCRLPSKPVHGSFNIVNCAPNDGSQLCRKVAGTEVPNYNILQFSCDAGFSLAGGSLNPCIAGQWNNSHPTCVPISCPKLESVSVDFRCSLGGKKVPCNELMAPGTEAIMTCKIAYRLPNEPGYNRAVCLENGRWDKPIFSCVQECGKRNPKGKPFISNGEVALVGEFPWHVGIYENSEDELKQICGGSLLNPSTVITAAHCFWSEGLRRVKDKSKFKITVGKYYRDWNVKDEEMQESDLGEIIVHPDYRGRPGLYSRDIAIVKLNISVQLTWAVLPVCMDFNNEYERTQLYSGSLGTIVGWGATEKNEYSPVLVTTSLPFIDYHTCIDAVPETFQPYLTPTDKFCAGYQNGTSVCPGDSGGGLAYEHDKRFYLRGIVSVGVAPEDGFKCFTTEYAAFTRVSDYLNWIQNYVR